MSASKVMLPWAFLRLLFIVVELFSPLFWHAANLASLLVLYWRGENLTYVKYSKQILSIFIV